MKYKPNILAKWLLIILVSCCFVKPSQAVSLYWPEYERGNTSMPVAIKAIQCLLIARGYKIKVDGRFGKETQRAVQRFQSSRGLKASGVMTSATWEKLIIKLRKGSKGYAVRSLQMQLNLIGFKTKTTNVFDAQTEGAVKAFQKRGELEVDGIVGRNTWSKLTLGTALYYE